MKKIYVPALLLLIGILGFSIYSAVTFKHESENTVPLSEDYDPSPHANLRPTAVDYGMVLDSPEPEVLGRYSGFTLQYPSIACVNSIPVVSLEWNKYRTDSNYIVQRKYQNQRWISVSVLLSSDITSFQDTRLGAQGTYTYRIRSKVSKNIAYSTEAKIENIDCSGQVASITPGNIDTPTGPIVAPTPTPVQESIQPQPAPIPSVVTPATPITPTISTNPPTTNTSPSPVVTSSALPSPLIWGAFNGWRVEGGAAFETAVGKKLMNRAVFVHWGNENDFPSYLGPSLKANNATLTIFWEAMDYNGPLTNQPQFSYDAIIRGDWDSYIKTFASDAKAYEGQVILIPFEEMNGNWNPWAGTMNGNTPEKHIQAYRHIKQLFTGVNNVKFGWAVNNGSVPNISGNQLENYYPGDSFVDIVGVDGFNFNNPWQTFAEVFDGALTRLAAYKKPIYIFSMASAEGSGKAAWIRDALSVQIQKYPRVVGWIWFNEKKERDWRVWSDPESLSAFKNSLPN